MKDETEAAKIEYVDLDTECHGILTLTCTFDYGGSGQGLGSYAIDIDFIKKFMAACGKERLADCKGQIVLVTHTHDKVTKIVPMPFNEGKEFDIEKWSAKFKKK